MGLFDGIAGSLETQAAEAVAGKMGIDPSVAAQAVSALTRNHSLPGDTVTQAAGETGIPTDMLHQILGHIGGEAGLGGLVGALTGQAQGGEGAAPAGGLGGILSGLGGLGGVTSMLDRDGDGNPLNDIAGMAGGLFGKK